MKGNSIPADLNPFRVTRIEGLVWRAPGFDWNDFLARLEARNYRGAIVGPHGSGKTTLLLEARTRLATRGIPVHYVFLNVASVHKFRILRQALEKIGENTVLFLDGAEQLNGIQWAWLRWRARRMRGLVITIHRPGRLPILQLTESNEVLLMALLGQLAGNETDLYKTRALEHFRRLEGNVREVFFALYDDCATGRFQQNSDANC